ncbi:hypothetical protein [uncultured Gammaproteobacteria bacterium]|nr:hypothetical protein [uncultured Gammaproteobacteria bacterium]
MEKPTFHPLGDFFKACPSRAKAGFKKIAKWVFNGYSYLCKDL